MRASRLLHQLGGRQQVTGPVEEGSVSHVSSAVTLRLAAGELAAELSGVDGRGAEGTVAAFPHSLLHMSLDISLQVMSSVKLCEEAAVLFLELTT